ncbi:NlpC/P60 family protein [Paenibacillus antri]|uniref:NlpC/P60 family protein n=1 Tax=Paenibacillus antri TaxID=2582848 RepID=A0A5R9GIY0_9BACL|nr:SH3 domain-containing C40 family peptidase [Paenibacillus antri]TLS52813.1 NlpC/P60 family protein [Paenibacillus antri]
MKLVTPIVALGLALSMTSSFLAVQASAASFETKVTYGVNFREAPNTASTVKRMLRKGEDIHVMRQVNDRWLKIETSDGKTGYISANDKYTNYGDSKYATAIEGVNVRRDAKISSNKIGFIQEGDKVQVIETVNRYWLKINYRGKIGYASASYFDYKTPSRPKPDVSASEIIATAKSYMGDFDYKWGAEPWTTNDKYSDCSAFVQLVFNREHGFDLPRVSRNQAKEGSYVKKSNLLTGDLVFFDTNTNGTINHVGIYIGNGDFIHSAPSNEVGISNLHSGYWEDHYVTARRVLQ